MQSQKSECVNAILFYTNSNVGEVCIYYESVSSFLCFRLILCLQLYADGCQKQDSLVLSKINDLF